MKTITLILCGVIASATLSGCTAVVLGAGAAAGGASQVSGDRRTFGTMVDDSAIESVAKDEIEMIDEIGFDSSNIGTTSINGVLLVHGQTKSTIIQKNLEKTCLKIKGVKKVYNAVTLSDNVSFGQSSKDSWITTKIKTKLIGESNLSSNSIKVVTENSIVYLMGVVTKTDGSKAANIAANTDGVQKVVTLYEYVADDDQTQTTTENIKTVDTDTTQVPSPNEEILSSDTIDVTDL